MKCENIDNYSVYDYSLVKYTKMGNVTQVVSLAHKNNECPIQKINKDEYVLLDTGEILECNHIENRGQNINSIRYSISNLRNLINNNFFGGSNELWITLTFGNNKVYNPNDLCPIFEKFIKRLRYFFKDLKLDYIYVPEPHEKGDWHIHLLLKADKSLYIENSKLNEIWQHGFVKVNRLKDIDNIGAYVSAYLINIKDGEVTKKGARLYLYPPQHKLYRFSKGINIPKSEYITYDEAKKRISSDKLTYKNTMFIQTDNGFENTIHYEYYNSKR
ncbi:MAG: hypothetical protein K1W33_00855 [Clostridia bacterium]